MLGIYCRISKDRPNQKSIKEQRELGKEFAMKMDWEPQIYEDIGISGGKSIEDRPGLYQMVKDIENGIVDSVFYYNQDRIERDELTWLTLSQLLIDQNISLYENGVYIDLDNPDVQFMSLIKTGLNAHYRRTISNKIKDVLKRNASEGKAHGRTPFGYNKDENGYLIINEDESQIVNEIYDMSLEGMGTGRIANYLNSKEIPTQYNKIGGTFNPTNRHTGIQDKKLFKEEVAWVSATIYHILTNPFYKGERRFSGNTYKAPIIIQYEKWGEVQENLKKNRSYSGKKSKFNYLLRGKIVCGRCGRYYHGRTRLNKKDHYYMCSSKRDSQLNCGNRSINIDVIEDFIWSRFFLERILLEKVINYYTQTDINEKIIDIKSNIKHQERLLKQNKKEQSRVRELVVKNIFKEEEGDEDLGKLRNEFGILDGKKSNLKAEHNSLERLLNDQENITKDLENIKANASFNEKIILIQEWIKNIKIFQMSGCHILRVEFKSLPIEHEDYLIPYPKLDYAIEFCNKIYIPLSNKYKDDELTEQDYLEIIKKWKFVFEQRDNELRKIEPTENSTPYEKYRYRFYKENLRVPIVE